MLLKTKGLVKELCSASFVSGYELSEQNNVILGYLQKHNIPYEIDSIGNIVFQKSGNGEKTLMLIAHYDEIGFAVKYIDDNGYVYFSAVGSVDTSILCGQKVIILHEGQQVVGVIGTKPIHMINQNRKEKKSPDISDLWIDIGAIDKEEAVKHVAVGDPISFYSDFTELTEDIFTSKSIDNRVGVVVLFSVYEQIRNAKVNYQCIYFVLSSQEELGLRGARTAGYTINPDTCIAIDVTHATDYPTISKNKYGDVRLNRGAVIPIGSNFNTSLQKKLRGVAAALSKPYQIESLPSYSGTDIFEVQLTRGGVCSGLISIPCRYMHSPIEVASFRDLQSAIDIISNYSISKNE